MSGNLIFAMNSAVSTNQGIGGLVTQYWYAAIAVPAVIVMARTFRSRRRQKTTYRW